MVTNFTTELMNGGLTEAVLGQLNSLDWTAQLAGLQRAAALGTTVCFGTCVTWCKCRVRYRFRAGHT